MLDARGLFTSPEWYPCSMDLRRRVVNFVRMSPQTYRETVFLDTRTLHVGTETYQFKLDDLLLTASNTPAVPKKVLYILHPTFCCSTLLARYFELLPDCFVLKEPMLLTQLAVASQRPTPDWNAAFDLAVRFLTRTYDPADFVVIKAHEPCNALGRRLLDHNELASVTFLATPLRHFLLAILKSDFRRKWVRTRIPAAARAARCRQLADIRPEDVNDAQAAAYLWLVNRFLYEQLVSGNTAPRVLALEGEMVAESPGLAIPAVMAKCGIHLQDEQLKFLIDHPDVRRYSKDLSKPYDAASRRQEIAELEKQWGNEADAAIDWASRYSTTNALEWSA